MPRSYLCDSCRSLCDDGGAASPHTGLRPILELGERQLYRCRHCGAFATSPGGDQAYWSLNVMGLPVPPQD